MTNWWTALRWYFFRCRLPLRRSTLRAFVGFLWYGNAHGSKNIFNDGPSGRGRGPRPSFGDKTRAEVYSSGNRLREMAKGPGL